MSWPQLGWASLFPAGTQKLNQIILGLAEMIASNIFYGSFQFLNDYQLEPLCKSSTQGASEPDRQSFPSFNFCNRPLSQ